MNGAARPLLIIGAGGHGRVVADIARAMGEVMTGFLDDAPGPGVLAAIRPGVAAHLASHRFVVAIGHMGLRREFAELVLAAGGELATLVHPTAILAPDVTIGDGTVIMAGAIINTGSALGRFVIINTGSILDHDNLVEDNVHIAPGCALAGNVICRTDAFVGIGTAVIPKVEIGAGAYVAAGSVVNRDVAPHVLAAGCPAVEKRRL